MISPIPGFQPGEKISKLKEEEAQSQTGQWHKKTALTPLKEISGAATDMRPSILS